MPSGVPLPSAPRLRHAVLLPILRAGVVALLGLLGRPFLPETLIVLIDEAIRLSRSNTIQRIATLLGPLASWSKVANDNVLI